MTNDDIGAVGSGRIRPTGVFVAVAFSLTLMLSLPISQILPGSLSPSAPIEFVEDVLGGIVSWVSPDATPSSRVTARAEARATTAAPSPAGGTHRSDAEATAAPDARADSDPDPVLEEVVHLESGPPIEVQPPHPVGDAKDGTAATGQSLGPTATGGAGTDRPEGEGKAKSDTARPRRAARPRP